MDTEHKCTIALGNYAKIKKWDIANGEGIRTSIFLSGCDLGCKGCFNKEIWDFHGGNKVDDTVLETIYESMNTHIDGLSILGGEPLHSNNIASTHTIVTEFHKRFPEKTIWLWTGYEEEEINQFTLYEGNEYENSKCHMLIEILSIINVLVTGRFVEELKDPNLLYRGSSNQKVKRLKNI